MTREKMRRSFLKIDSMQTSTKTARKIASAVGTVITKATWSSTFWKKERRQSASWAERSKIYNIIAVWRENLSQQREIELLLRPICNLTLIPLL